MQDTAQHKNVFKYIKYTYVYKLKWKKRHINSKALENFSVFILYFILCFVIFVSCFGFFFVLVCALLFSIRTKLLSSFLYLWFFISIFLHSLITSDFAKKYSVSPRQRDIDRKFSIGFILKNLDWNMFLYSLTIN